MKRTGFVAFFTRRFIADVPLHPIEGKLAKRWIKQRLLRVFPELRNNPEALERAYQELDLEPRPGTRSGEGCFELISPDDT